MARSKQRTTVPKKKQSLKEKEQNAPIPHHKRDFDQLLDDAIFGVKKKNPPG